jgi:hypothetical protein
MVKSVILISLLTLRVLAFLVCGNSFISVSILKVVTFIQAPNFFVLEVLMTLRYTHIYVLSRLASIPFRSIVRYSTYRAPTT